MPNVEIRRPQIGYVEELKQFFSLVLTDTYAKEGLADRVQEMEQEIQDKENLVREDLASDGEKRYFLMALVNGKIIGTIEYGATSQLVIDCTEGRLKGVIEVGTVFVHPDYQKQGVGSLLLNIIYLTFLNRKIKEFCLDSGYPNAQKVWQKKLGMPAYILKDYWGVGYDHMVWRKPTSELSIVFRV
jgi:GNAT superfamily N-acetyltransferase